ncbi:MAG: hypothetical protein HY761_07500 [Candidatus Omnitrophica bacterium]|nr:hypothetical protein [Candidatus Omnitrophota bacterium]
MIKKIIIFCLILFSSVTICLGSYFDDPKSYTQLQIYTQIMEADVIVAGKIARLKSEEDSDVKLLSLTITNIIVDVFSAEQSFLKKLNLPKDKLFIIAPNYSSFELPLFRDNEQHLVFLKKADINRNLREYFLLDETTTVYQACKGWRSAIFLDFSMKSLDSKILKERYDISDPQELIKVVKKLCVWRGFQEKDKKITALLELLNENKDSKIYLDNIPPMLATLGVNLVEKDGKYFAEKIKFDKWGHPLR